jgi:hypothetical protein
MSGRIGEGDSFSTESNASPVLRATTATTLMRKSVAERVNMHPSPVLPLPFARPA